MDGVNDTDDQAAKLAEIARRMRAHVNLIALNPTPLSPERASSEPRIATFARELERRGVNVTIRDTRGKDIDAACGQLAGDVLDRTNAAQRLAQRRRREGQPVIWTPKKQETSA